MMTTDDDIFLGFDVGKTDHWAGTVPKDGKSSGTKLCPTMR